MMRSHEEYSKPLSWLVWLSELSAGLQTKVSLDRLPVRAHAWVVSQVPSWGAHERQPHTDGSLLYSPSLPLSLKINK